MVKRIGIKEGIMTFEELMSSMVTEPKATEAKKTVNAPSVPVGAENKSEYENTLDSAKYLAEKICDGEVVNEAVAVNVFKSLAALYKKQNN